MNRCIRLLSVAAALVLTIGANAPDCGGAGTLPCGTFTEFAVPFAVPHGIVYFDSTNAGPMKGIWFTNATLDATSGVVEFSNGTGKTKAYQTPTAAAMPGSINFMPGGDAIWFTETNADRIARIDQSRKITEFLVPTKHSKPLDIQHGPGDGAMWFTESAAGKVGRITPSGKVTEFVVGGKDDEPEALIAQDGAMWFTEVGTGRIGRVTPSGTVTHFPTGPGKLTGDMTNTDDGAIWAPKTSSVLRLKTDGTYTNFPLPGFVNTGQIFGHGNGVLMGGLRKDGQGAILYVGETGQVREFDLPRKNLMPVEMAVDPDGGYFVTVESHPAGHSVSMIWRMQ